MSLKPAWSLNADRSNFVQNKILSNYHMYTYAVSKIRISNTVYVGNSFPKTSFLKLVFHMEISFCRGFSFGLGRLSQMRKSLQSLPMYQSCRLRASLLGHRLFYHFLSNFILNFYENDTKILETLKSVKTQNSLWQVSKVNKSSDVSIHLKFPPSFTFSLLLNKATLHLYLKKITRFFIYKCRVFR